MKGVILAGGMGTRLRPLTLITNKHLLPVFDRPMILYPLETLRRSGVTEIMVVCGKEHAGSFMNFLGSGREHGVRLSYALQDTPNGGIADALRSAEDFSGGGPVAVILGDNIFEEDFTGPIARFREGAVIFLKKVADPRRFGVAVFDKTETIVRAIEEKPKRPKSPYAQTGFYLFDAAVFSHIRGLKPSGRGEIEITDAVNAYIGKRALRFEFVKGFWSDAGTFGSLLESANWAAGRSKGLFNSFL